MVPFSVSPVFSLELQQNKANFPADGAVTLEKVTKVTFYNRGVKGKETETLVSFFGAEGGRGVYFHVIFYFPWEKWKIRKI